MQQQPVAGRVAEGGPHGLAGLGPEMEPGHLVLVLVGHELVQIEGHRLGQVGGVAAHHPLLALGHPAQELHVAGGQRPRLVVDQVGRPSLGQAGDGTGQGRPADQGSGLDRGPHRRDRPRGAGLFGRDRVPRRPGVGHDAAAPGEGGFVGGDGHAVELDGPLDGLDSHGHAPGLVGRPQGQEVGLHVVAEQGLGHLDGIEADVVVLAGHPVDGQKQVVGVGVELVGVGHHLAGGHPADGDHGQGALGGGPGQVAGVGRHQQVEAQIAVGQPGADVVGAAGGAVEQAQVRHHRAALLAEPGLVQARHLEALQHRRGGQHLAGGDHAGAAHPGHVQRVSGGGNDRPGRFGELDRHLRRRRAGAPGLGLGGDLDERRAVALDAGVVEVARRLMNAGLGAELGFDGLDRQAVALGPAVAAALAHRLVDEDPLGRGGDHTPLAVPALLGRAALVVDENGHAGGVAQGPLGLLQPVPGPYVGAGGEARAGAEPVGVVAAHHDPRRPLGGQGGGQLGHVHGPGHGLAPGHGHRPVVEDLVGEVDPGGHRGPHGQAARVEQGAVAQVLEQVGPVGEGGPADPGGPLAAHLVDGEGPVVDPQRHGVAAHSPRGDGTLEHFGGAVVGAAAAEVGGALDLGAGGLAGLLDQGQPGLHLAARQGEPAAQPGGHDGGDAVGGELAVGGDQQAALLVVLADDAGGVGPSVEDVPHEQLHEGPLLVQHQDLGEALGHLGHHGRLQRPHHPHLQQADAAAVQLAAAEAEVGQGLAELVEGAAGGHDAQPRPGAGPADPVEPVGGGVGLGRLQAPVGDLGLLAQADGGDQAGLLDVAPRLAVDDQLGLGGGHPVGGDLGGGQGVGQGGDDLEAHPQPRVAGQGEAVEAEVEHLLDRAGVQDRHLGVVEGRLGVGGQGGRLGHGVVAGQGQHPAVGGRALEVGVLEHVAAAVDAGAFAVPHAQHPVVAVQRTQQRFLAAPHRGGGQVLVHPRHPHHVVVAQQPQVALDGHVERAQRRALVAGDEGGGAQAPGPVGPVLVEREPDQGLYAGQQHPAPLQRVLLVEVEIGDAGGGCGVGGGCGHRVVLSSVALGLASSCGLARQPVSR